MAQDRDELNRRRQEREARKKQRLAEQRKLRMKLILAGAVLIACAVGIFVIARNSASSAPEELQRPTVQQTEAPVQEITEPTSRNHRESVKVIHIRAAGDLNVTDKVILAGAGGAGYNFINCFKEVMPILSEADLTMLNFEGNLCGEPYGTATTSAPNQIADALRAAGVDIVQTANSASVNNGLIGLTSTLNAFRNAGVEPVGTFASTEEFRRTKGYTICEVQGIRIAVVAFTKGIGSMGLPVGSEDCVNLLYTDYATTYREIDTEGIKDIMKAVASEKPDITIAMLHWGSEHNDVISDSQKRLVSMLQKQGVDVILGTHSHRVQEIDFNEETGTLVAYSLGDFFGDGKDAGTNYSIILDVEITQDLDAGTTKVTGFSYFPIYTLQEEDCDGQRRVVLIENSMRAYEENFIDRITAAAYAGMDNALERIEARVDPEAWAAKQKAQQEAAANATEGN